VSSSARRTLHVLETIGHADRPLGVTEIGRQLGISAGTVFRGLDALERGGFIARYQASSRCVLGPAVSRLRRSVFARFPIREICLPYLRQLAFASGETTSLVVPIGWYGLRLAAAPGTNEVTTSPSLGEVHPLMLAGGAGKAILAFQSPDTMKRHETWLKRVGLRAPADGLSAELAAIRKRGYAVEKTAFASGRAAVAFPVRQGERAIAAIAIEGPVVDLNDFDGKTTDGELSRWLDIVHTIEALARARPSLFENPFDHIDADAIELKWMQ
jgi:DNA-binding IclR family transcriptional regulator